MKRTLSSIMTAVVVGWAVEFVAVPTIQGFGVASSAALLSAGFLSCFMSSYVYTVVKRGSERAD